MQLQISYRGMDHDPGLEAIIAERAEKLQRLHSRISRCEVMIEASSNRKTKGDLAHVRIYLTVPGGEVVVGRDPGDRHAHEDVRVALRDAFDAARRQLQDFSQRRRGEVKAHGLPA